jgi:two-component system phosphate regulon response regulator OmpR
METSAGPVPDDAAHLLVVDDDRRLRDLLSRYLQREGYRVTTAKNAADARIKLDGLTFDLLILDVMMPGETGFELAKSVRKASQVPILMLTARAETEHRINGLEIGADDYMAKPFEARELSLRVASILKRAQPTPAPPAESVRFGPFVFPARPCRASALPASGRPPASGPSTCRSTGCVARSRAIPPIRCTFKPCAASVTGFWC